MSTISAAFSTIIVAMGIFGLTIVGPDKMHDKTENPSSSNGTASITSSSKKENYVC